MQEHFPTFGLLHDLKAESYLGAALHDSADRPIGLIAILHGAPLKDLHVAQSTLQIFASRAAAELERLRQQEQLSIYRDIVSSTRDFISFVDADYCYRAVNQAYLDFLDCAQSDIVGQHVTSIHSKELFEHELKPLLDRALQGETASIEHWVRAPSGSERYVSAVYSPHLSTEGLPRSVIVTTRDQTKSRLIAIERERLTDALRQAHKMEALGEFTGGMAHEFNNALAVIVGFAELARLHHNVTSDQRLKGHIDQIVTAGRKAKTVVDQLLHFSPRKPICVEAVDLEALLSSTKTMLRPLIPSSIHFRVAVEGDVPVVSGDESQLQQALVNLCINARDAILYIGEISIRLTGPKHVLIGCASCGEQVEGEYVELAVIDDGASIESADAQRIFQPLFTTKPVGKGSGMGLAVVHGIAHEHAGHVGVVSNARTGTSVSLYLPVGAPTVPRHCR
ncbi:MAG: PAS domain S-box-containing protein [Gammaproteobacteria bacterium]